MLTLLLVTTGRFGLLVKKQVYAHLWLLISTFHAPSRQRIDSLPLNTTGTLFHSLNSYQKILQLCHTGLDPQYGRSFFFAKSWLLHYLPMGKSLFCLHEPTVNNKILQVTWRTCFSFTHALQRYFFQFWSKSDRWIKQSMEQISDHVFSVINSL